MPHYRLPPISEYTLPKLCARCGLRQGAELWKIESQTSKMDPTTFFLALLFGIIAVRRQTVKRSFSVLVCPPCKTRLEKAQKLPIQALLLGAALGGFVAGVLFFIGSSRADMILMGLFLGSLPGGVVGLIAGRILEFMTSPGIGSFDGEYFYFTNRAFQRQFAKLNPSLVSDLSILDPIDRKP